MSHVWYFSRNTIDHPQIVRRITIGLLLCAILRRSWASNGMQHGFTKAGRWWAGSEDSGKYIPPQSAPDSFRKNRNIYVYLYDSVCLCIPPTRASVLLCDCVHIISLVTPAVHAVQKESYVVISTCTYVCSIYMVGVFYACDGNLWQQRRQRWRLQQSQHNPRPTT